MDRYVGGGATIKNTVRGSTKTKITGLSPFTKYSIRVRAFTRKGPGPWSEPVQFQTAAAPEVCFDFAQVDAHLTVAVKFLLN